MKNVQEVQLVQEVAQRLGDAGAKASQDEILRGVLTDNELCVLKLLQDSSKGPFAKVTGSGLYEWDGIAAAWEFWGQQGRSIYKWQR
jgi:hypothetical protein